MPVGEVPETRFATTGSGDRVAFQVMGEGPLDVLVNRYPAFPIDLLWDEPRVASFLNRLSSFCRHIWFDPRGMGASDRIGRTEGQFAETVIEDMVAVLDEVDCERAALLQLGGLGVDVLFAATHPQRTSALVLMNTNARLLRGDDYPEGVSNAAVDERWLVPSV